MPTSSIWRDRPWDAASHEAIAEASQSVPVTEEQPQSLEPLLIPGRNRPESRHLETPWGLTSFEMGIKRSPFVGKGTITMRGNSMLKIDRTSSGSYRMNLNQASLPGWATADAGDDITSPSSSGGLHLSSAWNRALRSTSSGGLGTVPDLDETPGGADALDLATATSPKMRSKLVGFSYTVDSESEPQGKGSNEQPTAEAEDESKGALPAVSLFSDGPLVKEPDALGDEGDWEANVNELGDGGDGTSKESMQAGDALEDGPKPVKSTPVSEVRKGSDDRRDSSGSFASASSGYTRSGSFESVGSLGSRSSAASQKRRRTLGQRGPVPAQIAPSQRRGPTKFPSYRMPSFGWLFNGDGAVPPAPPPPLLPSQYAGVAFPENAPRLMPRQESIDRVGRMIGMSYMPPPAPPVPSGAWMPAPPPPPPMYGAPSKAAMYYPGDYPPEYAATHTPPMGPHPPPPMYGPNGNGPPVPLPPMAHAGGEYFSPPYMPRPMAWEPQGGETFGAGPRDHAPYDVQPGFSSGYGTPSGGDWAYSHDGTPPAAAHSDEYNVDEAGMVVLPNGQRVRPVMKPFNKSTARQRRSANTVARFECAFCGETFTRRYNLKGHERAHLNEKPFVCSFEGCGKAFARQHDCRRHEQLHAGKRRHKCESCGRLFVRLDALQRHHRSEAGQACVQDALAKGSSVGNDLGNDIKVA